MHPEVNAAFDRLCQRYGLGGEILEIGATPTPDTLLNLPALSGATRRLGVNMEAASQIGGAEILSANAHALPMLATGSFDAVLCNATFEHDPMFWLTLAEIRRLLRPAGIAIFGVPGYIGHRGLVPRVKGLAARLWPSPLPGSARLAGAAASTATLQIHNYPGDYYRFSEQAMRDVLLDGFDVLEIEVLLQPPRIIGVGRKRG
jgi:SAM-dependent methyltransferase